MQIVNGKAARALPKNNITKGERDKLLYDDALATLQLADIFGVGGDTWLIERGTGGDTAEATLATIGYIKAYICETRHLLLTQAANAQAVPVAGWTFVAAGISINIQNGDTLSSNADARYVFVLGALEEFTYITRGEAQKL